MLVSMYTSKLLPSAHPNVCDICNWKLWLSVSGAFSQLMAQSGYKKNSPEQGI